MVEDRPQDIGRTKLRHATKPHRILCSSADLHWPPATRQRRSPAGTSGGRRPHRSGHMQIPEFIGAGEENRTPDIQLGKLSFYH